MYIINEIINKKNKKKVFIKKLSFYCCIKGISIFLIPYPI